MSEEYEGRWILEEEEEPPREHWLGPLIGCVVMIMAVYYTIEGIQKSKRR